MAQVSSWKTWPSKFLSQVCSGPELSETCYHEMSLWLLLWSRLLVLFQSLSPVYFRKTVWARHLVWSRERLAVEARNGFISPRHEVLLPTQNKGMWIKTKVEVSVMRTCRDITCFCEEIEDLGLQSCHLGRISTKLSSKYLKRKLHPWASEFPICMLKWCCLELI